MCCLCPKGYAAIFQPLVQLVQILEDTHDLPHATSGITNILLDLTFLPACSRIAKHWLKDVLAGHSLEPRVDVTLLATPDAIDRSLTLKNPMSITPYLPDQIRQASVFTWVNSQ